MNLPFGAFPAVGSLIYVIVGSAGAYELSFASQLYAARAESRTRDREDERIVE